MSNGARHTWGFLAGLVLTAAFAALLIIGTYRLQGNLTRPNMGDKWVGVGLIAAAAVVYALLLASRLSPLGSLIGGLVLTAAGMLFFISQKTATDLINQYPVEQHRVTLSGLENEGVILFAGVGLLFASFFPSRWRARDDDGPDVYEYNPPPKTPEPYTAAAAPDDPYTARYSGHDEQHATPTAYGTPPGDYQTGYKAQRQPGYGTPLHEPEEPYADRSLFDPSADSGTTREMHRPE